ncbi:hypothetical protein [Cucumibacter marinus]|uniref:hypothetical protein n=1 Tax=Cucumibacter marinus TaxID=1121252 RepID=UPI00040CA303|nr:hypothetical protein [Cucumibacter marinus]
MSSAAFFLSGSPPLLERGREFIDPYGLLEGAQKRIRSIRFRPGDGAPSDLPEGAISEYIAEAIALRW